MSQQLPQWGANQVKAVLRANAGAATVTAAIAANALTGPTTATPPCPLVRTTGKNPLHP